MTKTRIWTGCVWAAGLAFALGAATGVSAQASSTRSSSTANSARTTEPSATPAEQPRRRDRRRPDEVATAATAAVPAAVPADTAASDEPKLICKNIKPIGSRVARRICGTEEQWAADNARTSADAEEGMRQIRGRSGVSGGSSSGPASLGSPSFGQ